MTQPSEYKRTLFDRSGPDAVFILRAAGYGIMVSGISVSVLAIKLGFSLTILCISLIAGAAVAFATYFFALGIGKVAKHVWVDGSSTPYREQYSYQQALVMQRKVDEALTSFESLIAERPEDADIRIRAAELCAREKQDFVRAAEFFRAAQRVRSITPGEDVLVTNRLVDLYTGPLNTPGRALVELRRLIDRHPDSPAAINARVALATLKSRAEISAE